MQVRPQRVIRETLVNKKPNENQGTQQKGNGERDVKQRVRL